MKIVIDIYEGVYDMIERDNTIFVPLIDTVTQAILNGTVIHKGHGKLIDMNEIYIALHDEIEREKGDADEEYLEGIRCAYALIDTSPAVIEADKGEE